MKFYAALLAVLMVRIAVGQSGVVRFPQGEPGQFLHADNAGVPQWVYKDKFGKLCAVGQILRGKLCYTPKPAPKPAHHVSYFRQDCDSSGAICGPTRYAGPPPAAALDVPAIHHDFIPVASYAECPMDYMWATRGDGKHLCQPPREYTCAEKSRILEHDEQTPPKFWCRKVQQ